MSRSALLFTLIELGPTMAFFIAGQVSSFSQAVTVLMITTTIACTVAWIRERRLPFVPVFSALFVLIGGAATLYFNQADAIIIADTVYYLSLSTLLGITLLRKKNLLKFFFWPVFAITDRGWHVLSWRWFWFLLLAACSNEAVRFFATPETWIDYRFYKTFVVLAFATYQFTLTRTYRIPEESNSWGLRVNTPDQTRNK